MQAQYQTQSILASYIAKIVPGNREVDVDHLWTNLLACYFPTLENTELNGKLMSDPDHRLGQMFA